MVTSEEGAGGGGVGGGGGGPSDGLCQPWTCKKLVPSYDFKTSTNIGLQARFPHASFNEVNVMSGLIAPKKDYHHRDLQYRTTSSAHDGTVWAAMDPIASANRISGTRCHFMKEFKESLRWNQPNRASPLRSQQKLNFRYHGSYPGRSGHLSSLEPDLMCQIKGPARDEQEKFELNIRSANSLMDPYVSTTKYDFIRIPKSASDFFKSKKLRVEPRIIKKPEDVFEEAMFRMKFLDRTVPKRPPRVPHRGIKSETSERFVSPWGGRYRQEDKVEYPVTSHRRTKGEVLAVPAMYHTEYSHIGTPWSTTQLV